MADIAVTGGSGLVGGDLIRGLVSRGDTVTALVRSREAAATVATLGAKPAVVDLFDHDGVRDAVWGTDILYHVAGVNTTCVRSSTEMDRINIDGTRAVIAAASDGGVGRVVYTSSAATIGEGEGIHANEDIVHDGVYLSAYARSKHLAEIAAFQQGEESGIDVVAVNPSSVQGPGRSGGSAKLLLYALRSRRPWLVETSISVVDIEDCTTGHILAADHGRAGRRYLLSGATLRVSDAIDLAESVSGRTIDPRWLSEGVVRTIGRPVSAILALVMPRSEVCPALIDTLLHGHRFDASRSERELGMRYTPIEDTFRRTIDWLVDQGLIDES